MNPLYPQMYKARLRGGEIAFLLRISLAAPLFSQSTGFGSDPLQNQPQNVTPPLSAESLQQLVAPIALYPDALIALILPASTSATDVVLASRYLASNGDPQNIPSQSWDSSVKSLAAYPQIISWMDGNLEWTTALGEAFVTQQADVMGAIQQLRLQAQNTGNLVDTPQQQIVTDDGVIRILPADPTIIYIPQYDPQVIYVQTYSPGYGPLITFGVGCAAGAWLNYDCDWNHHQIYQGVWHPGWNHGHSQHGGTQGVNNAVSVVNLNKNTARPWHPNPQNRLQLLRRQQNLARFNSSPPPNGQRASSFTAGSSLNYQNQIHIQIPRPSRVNFVGTVPATRSPEVAPQRATIPPPQIKQIPVAAPEKIQFHGKDLDKNKKDEPQ